MEGCSWWPSHQGASSGKTNAVAMASNDPQHGGEAGGADGAGQGGPQPGRALVTVDGVALAAVLARREQLQKRTEELLTASMRHGDALHRVVARQERVIAALRRQVAALPRHEASPASPDRDSRSP